MTAAACEQFLKSQGRAPGLHVVLVGNDPASEVYVRNKERAASKVGMAGRVHRLKADVHQDELLALIDDLNRANGVDGILVQLPLPAHLSPDVVVGRIDPGKDVDGLHAVNAGRLLAGQEGLRPCTPSGCVALLRSTGVDLQGKHVLVVGRSVLVGKPVSLMLLEANATVTIAHSRTSDLAEQCGRADVLVAAVGKEGLIDGRWVKEGGLVVDVGINRRADGSLCGDVCFDTARERAAWITPVPGGVGPMTIAMLLQNTMKAATARAGITLTVA